MPMFERKDCLTKKFFTKIALIPLFTFLFVFQPYSSFAAATVNLAWDPSPGPDVAGYKVYYGTSSRNYAYNVNVGKSTSCSLSGLAEGKKYYFAATAYNSSNAESSYSSEISHTIPTSSASNTTTSSSATNTNTSNLTPDYNSTSTIFSLEAEDGDIHNAMVTAGDNNASSGTYILVPNGGGSNGYAAYTFQVTSAGNYVVWGRVLAPNGTSDSFYVAMDGGAESIWDTAISTKWVWKKVSHRGGADPAVYNLATGKHTLTIKQREDGTKIDCVVITMNSSSAPSTSIFNGSPSTTTGSSSGTSSTSASAAELVNTEIEAEDGIMSGPMERAADNGASSGMYIWVQDGSGSGGSAKYYFEVAKAGNYIIWGRVLAPNGTSDSFYVSMDGGAESTWDTTISTKWVWKKVSHRDGANPVTYNLSAGKHTLVFKRREDGAKLDEFIITDDLSFKP